jgi:hypothetical protein
MLLFTLPIPPSLLRPANDTPSPLRQSTEKATKNPFSQTSPISVNECIGSPNMSFNFCLLRWEQLVPSMVLDGWSSKVASSRNRSRMFYGDILVCYFILPTFPLVNAGVDGCEQWNTLLAKHANRPTRYSRRRTVSSLCRASHAGRDALSILSRAVSRPRSGKEARTRLVEILYNRSQFWEPVLFQSDFFVVSSSITITLAVLSSISHNDRCLS